MSVFLLLLFIIFIILKGKKGKSFGNNPKMSYDTIEGQLF